MRKNDQRRWWQKRWITWPLGAFAGLIVVIMILQSLNIIDTPEETRQTETAVAAVVLDQTATAMASITPTITPTPTHTLTATASPSPTNTLPPSDTPLPTNTLPPSDTPPPTNTLPPSETPVPSATLVPEDVARAAFEDVFGRSREIDRLIVNADIVTIRFPLTDLSVGLARHEAENRLVDLVCELRETGLTGREYRLTGTIGVVDGFGNTSTAEGVEMIMPDDVVQQINCDNTAMINLAAIAERYDLSPLLEE